MKKMTTPKRVEKMSEAKTRIRLIHNLVALLITTLPNHRMAVLPIEKLTDCALNPDHAVGRHKARAFWTTLGITVEDAEWLRSSILRNLDSAVAIEMEVSPFGRRFSVDLNLIRHGRATIVRTAWIIRDSENFPRLTSCYPI
jgi:hypothetical protein